MKNPLVSIIVPTFNSEKYIKECLASLKSQSYKNIEIIVVDQSSKDSTQKTAKQMGAKLLVLPPPKFYSPPSSSRNRGARVSKGEILVHIDSDMVLSPRLIEEIVKKLNMNDGVGALIIHEQDITKGFWSKCKAFERRCYWGNDNIESARAVKKSIFKKVNGYDENLNSGEDFDIHKRYKDYCKIGFCNYVIYHNLGELGFIKTIRKKYNYGKTAGKYFQKHNTSGQSLLKEQFRCYYKNSFGILKNPLTGFGSIVLKISEFGAGGLGLLLQRYKV